ITSPASESSRSVDSDPGGGQRRVIESAFVNHADLAVHLQVGEQDRGSTDHGGGGTRREVNHRRRRRPVQHTVDVEAGGAGRVPHPDDVVGLSEHQRCRPGDREAGGEIGCGDRQERVGAGRDREAGPDPLVVEVEKDVPAGGGDRPVRPGERFGGDYGFEGEGGGGDVEGSGGGGSDSVSHRADFDAAVGVLGGEAGRSEGGGVGDLVEVGGPCGVAGDGGSGGFAEPPPVKRAVRFDFFGVHGGGHAGFGDDFEGVGQRHFDVGGVGPDVFLCPAVDVAEEHAVEGEGHVPGGERV